MKYDMLTDEQILSELAKRFERTRIGKRLKDTDIEAAGGVSRRILTNFRTGKGSITMKSFVRLLRGLGELEQLDNLLTVNDEYSPLPSSSGKRPKRVRDSSTSNDRAEPFHWGDER